jgi:hypothetical protein
MSTDRNAMLDEAVEHIAAKHEREHWSFPPDDPAHKSHRDALRAELELAEPFFATHYEQKGAEGERGKLDEALRHFESEANAAEELEKQQHPMTMTRQRYRVEASTYRYVLKTIASALSEKETEQPSPEAVKVYTTEHARMRLREVLTIAEWPQDGTAEEYFIREVFPDQPSGQER